MTNDEALTVAEAVFALTNYFRRDTPEDKEALQQEIIALANNIILVDQAGLVRLNENLIKSGRKVWDFIAEHNFACDLLRSFPGIPIDYEPEEQKRPIDFVFTTNGVTFWIQMKRLAPTERENRQRKVFDELKSRLKQIPIGLFVYANISQDFEHKDIEPLAKSIEESVSKMERGSGSFRSPISSARAKYSWHPPSSQSLNELTLGAYGDYGMVNCTGLEANQIRNSLAKAASAFASPNDSKNICLVAMESDDTKNIDLGEAFFGTEVFRVGQNGTVWYRDKDGFFRNSAYSSNVVGGIALRRKERRPISGYHYTLFMNPNFHRMENTIQDVFRLETVIHFNDYIDA